MVATLADSHAKIFIFSCPGYRHVRLLSSQGEELESATLFVHVTITNLNDAVAVSVVRGQV